MADSVEVIPARDERILDAPDRVLWTGVIGGALLAIALCAAIAGRDFVVGSRDGQWVYGYVAAPPIAAAFAVGLAAVGACCALVAATSVRLRMPPAQILLWMLAALALQALLRTLAPFSFAQIFASDGANSFYGVTRHYRASTVLRDFDRLRASFPIHAQSNMPGKLMLVYALRLVSRRADVLAWLVVAVSALGAPLMYVFVRDVLGDARAALFAAILYLFVPGKTFFFPLLNTVTPVVVLACGCLLTRWLRTAYAAYAAALGAAMYGLVFFEPLGLAIGLLFAALVGLALRRGDVSARTALSHAGFAVLGFAAAYALVYAFAGFDLWTAFRRISLAAIEFNADGDRPYSLWVRANLREFLVGTGACQVALVVAALADGVRSRGGASRAAIIVVCLGLMAVLAAIDLTGINRGEVTRLWIFLACFFQIPAAYVCARLESRAALALVLSVTLLEAALGTAMIGFVSP